MNGIISGNMVGGGAPLKTLILTDESGNEVVGVVTGSEVLFTATDNDVREGMVYASDSGVSTGSKNIPGYRTRAGIKLVLPHANFTVMIPEHDGYDYTVFICMVTLMDSDDVNNSVNTSMVVLNDGVYESNSTNKLATISKNTETQSIDFNISNDSDNYYVIHYFTYREEE